MGSASSGVVNVLVVNGSGSSPLYAPTTASEMEVKGAYYKYMTDSLKDGAVKTADITYKNNEKTMAETGPLVAGMDLKTTKEELAAATEYFEKPKPSCDEGG